MSCDIAIGFANDKANAGIQRLLSADGKSFSFDSRASGYGRGEGSATIILKRLDDAIRDGNPIRAVIRQTMINQDGKTETITSPSLEAQINLLRSCYLEAGLDPTQTTYFETHGTGTPTGDPTEANAIASLFRPGRPDLEPLLIGSVKTNIGHTETASGLASVIKVALALEKRQVPPNMNFEEPNPMIDFKTMNLKVRDSQPLSWNKLQSVNIVRSLRNANCGPILRGSVARR